MSKKVEGEVAPGVGVVAPELTTFEDLLEATGTKGRWNVLIFIMCALVSISSPLQALSYQFLGATPDHWCLVPELQAANWSQHQVLTLAIPYSNTTGKYEGCQMYDYDYVAAVEMGYEAALNNRPTLNKSSSLIQCTARDFNFTQYKSTVVTEWDLVCERRALYSTTQAVVMAGKLVGFIVFGYLIDKWGRRPVVLLTTVVHILATFLIAVSPNVKVYITFKFLITFMDSGQYLGLFVFIMESCAARYRAGVGSIFVIPWAIGYMAVPCIAYFIRDWQLLHVAYAVPTLYNTIYFWFLPESPRWLVTQSRFQEALKVLTWAAKVNKRTLPPDELILNSMAHIQKQAAIDEDPKEEQAKCGDCQGVLWWTLEAVKHLFILLIIPHLRVRTLVVFFCWFSASMVYYGVALNSGNLGTDPYLYVFLGGVLEVPSYLLLWPAMHFIGRKVSLSALYLIASVCLFSVMVVMLVEPENAEIVMVVLAQAGKVAVTAAFQLVWAYTAELYPTKLRSLAVGLSSFMARIGSLLSPYINDLMGAVTPWSPSAVFGVVSVVSAGLTLLLPETRDAVLSETGDVNTTTTTTTTDKPHKETNNTTDNLTMDDVRNGTENPTYVSDGS